MKGYHLQGTWPSRSFPNSGTQPSPVHLSKDSGTQPWSSFLEPGALHITVHSNQRHQMPKQMQLSEGTGLDL